MIRTDYDDLIEALDNYKDIQAKRRRDLDAPGHYDPCDYAKKHYEEEIRQAACVLDAAFRKIVLTHQRPCGCLPPD